MSSIKLNTGNFGIFGDGRSLVVAVKNELYVFKEVMMKDLTFSHRIERIDVTSIAGFREFVPGLKWVEADLSLVSSGEFIISKGNPFDFLGNYQHKTIFELMQIVNEKLKSRE